MGVWKGDTRENELFHIYGVLIFFIFLGGGGAGSKFNTLSKIEKKKMLWSWNLHQEYIKAWLNLMFYVDFVISLSLEGVHYSSLSWY